jgi:hypothetical protein
MSAAQRSGCGLVLDLLGCFVPAHPLSNHGPCLPAERLGRGLDRHLDRFDLKGDVETCAGDGLGRPQLGDLAQVALDGVAEPPIRPEHGRQPIKADGAVAVLAQRIVRKQAQGVTKVLAVDLPDLELGQQQVGQDDGGIRAAELSLFQPSSQPRHLDGRALRTSSRLMPSSRRGLSHPPARTPGLSPG